MTSVKKWSASWYLYRPRYCRMDRAWEIGCLIRVAAGDGLVDCIQLAYHKYLACTYTRPGAGCALGCMAGLWCKLVLCGWLTRFNYGVCGRCAASASTVLGALILGMTALFMPVGLS